MRQSIVEQHVDLSPTIGDELEIRSRRARATVNLINSLPNADRLEDAEALYLGFAELGVEPEIRIQKAKAAFGLIYFLSESDRLAEAEALFSSFSEIGDELEIIAERAKAAANLIIDLADSGRLLDAAALYAADLDQMPDVIEDIEAIRRVAREAIEAASDE